MMERDDRLYLFHIRECIARIEQYISAGRADFFSDTKTQDAVLRNLHTLAESSQRISERMKALQPQIDWRNIAAFRNVLVHDYLGIDLPRIWDIVQNDMPSLKHAIEAMLSSLG